MNETATTPKPNDPLLDLINKCNRCGFCQDVCPTYAQTKDETQLARGRIRLVRMIEEGKYDWRDDPELAAQVDNCLLCGACVAACPASVQTDEIMRRARRDVLKQEGFDLFHRLVYEGMLPHRRRQELAARLMKMYDRTGLNHLFQRGAAAKALGRLEYFNSFLPAPMGSPARKTLPPQVRPAGRPKAKAAYFVGCATNAFTPAAAEATLKLLVDAGLEVHLPDVVCCGGPHLAAGDVDRARTLIRQNVDLLAGGHYDHVITDCSTCAHTIKEYPVVLGEGDPVHPAAIQLAQKATDLMAFLADRPPSAAGSAGPGQVVTYHDSCHACRGLKVTEEPRSLLAAAPGVELAEMAGADSCCGGAGSYCFTHPDMSAKILDGKLKAAQATGADVVAAACPACILQIGAGARRANLDVQVKHPAEILAQKR